ncbi:MAG: DNA repair protein RecO, partial [Rhodospirillaceae bacterium]|nr:DNA repair protein RecO [Rhodospirillaceae bacterium]
MNWSDIGIVLSARKHGEGSAIVSLMTPGHGRHAGLVRGGSGKRARGIYEAGNLVSVEWRARLEDHLGSFTCELLQPQAALYLDDSLRLAGLSSACAVLEMALPEREPHPEVYESLFSFIANLSEDTWLEEYVKWELELLAELGFGLDLTACASTGQSEELIYVSPKSGQAVSTNAGEPYKDKLLALPEFLMHGLEGAPEIDFSALYLGLNLTGYFMGRHVFIHHKNG